MQVLKTSALLAVTIIFVSSLSHAQARRLATAVIPFDFQIGATKVDRGEYVIEQPGTSTMNRTVVIRKKSGGAVSMVNMLSPENGDKKATKSVLIFDRYGDSTHLSEIQLPGIDFFGRLRKPKHEIELVRPRMGPDRAIARIVIPAVASGSL